MTLGDGIRIGDMADLYNMIFGLTFLDDGESFAL